MNDILAEKIKIIGELKAEIESYQQTILYHYGFAMEESGLTMEEYNEHLDAYIQRVTTAKGENNNG